MSLKFEKLLVFTALLCGFACVNGVDEPTFRYVTAYNKEGRLLRKEDIEKTTVNVLRPIIFIINGPDKPDAVYKLLVEEYLTKQVHNVFIVDSESNQTQSTGLRLSDFIKELFNKTGETFLDIHLVGVLTGSQIAAIAGKRFLESTGRKVNRITALDPTYHQINDENTKIDIRDANFVDVVYSELSKFNKLPEEGQVRFYVYDEGCKEDFGKLIAVKLFAKSINSDKFKGVKCETVEDFKAGKCEKNENIVFGEGTDRSARGDYFVNACQ